MTTLMRIGRDRRSGKPVMCHARKERVLLFGTRSADYIRASGQIGRIQRPNTWLHPNSSLKGQIFPLHRGRRPYMALSGQSRQRSNLSAIGVTADKFLFLSVTVCPLMTQQRHWLCTAAMVNYDTYTRDYPYFFNRIKALARTRW